MGNDYSKDQIDQLIRDWRRLIDLEIKALKDSDLEMLEKSIDRSIYFQDSLDSILKPGKTALTIEQINRLKEIQEIQANLATEITKGRDMIAEKIAKLKSSRASIGGYKQNKSRKPRFFSQKT